MQADLELPGFPRYPRQQVFVKIDVLRCQAAMTLQELASGLPAAKAH